MKDTVILEAIAEKCNHEEILYLLFYKLAIERKYTFFLDSNQIQKIRQWLHISITVYISDLLRYIGFLCNINDIDIDVEAAIRLV